MLPQVGGNPLPKLCLVRDSLLNGFEDRGHVVDLVHRVDEHVDVIWHEDIGKYGKVVLFRGFVDTLGEGFANTIIEQVFFAMES